MFSYFLAVTEFHACLRNDHINDLYFMNQVTCLSRLTWGSISIIHDMTCDILDTPEWPEPEMLIRAQKVFDGSCDFES